jgi:hypothetical protein
MAREIELQIWGSVLERVMERVGARREGVLELATRRPDQEWPAERLARSARKRRALAALSHAQLNFDRSRQSDFTSANGWHIDDHRQPLPKEMTGPPVPGGSWDIARRLMRGYEFADPSIVRAFYDPDAPLEDRNMLLELRFLGLRFLVGTRVTRVYEETRTSDGRKTHVWGWSYATLEGRASASASSADVSSCASRAPRVRGCEGLPRRPSARLPGTTPSAASPSRSRRALPGGPLWPTRNWLAT